MRRMLVTLIAAVVMVGTMVQAATYYVAPDGRDERGRGSAQSPFATIQYALNQMAPGDECFVRSGIYAERVVIPVDNIKLHAQEPGAVVVSGADRITGWSVHEGDIWKAPLSWDLGKTANQLFINGEWMQEARHPNVDDWNLLDCYNRLDQRPDRCGDKEGVGFSAFADQQATIMNPTTTSVRYRNLFKSQHDGWPADSFDLHFSYWGAGKYLASPADNPHNVLTGKPRDHFVGASYWDQGWWWSGAGPITHSWDEGEEFHFRVATDRIRWSGAGVFIGHYDFIDRPGEWVLKDNMVYLKVPAGINPNTDHVSMKRRHAAFVLNGRDNVTITGFNVIGASALLDSTTNSTIDNCHFYCLTHYFNHTWGNLGYVALEPEELAAGNRGILIGGANNSFINSSITFSAASGIVNASPSTTIENNLIQDINYAHTYAAGVYILVGGITIKGNTFRRFARSALTGGLTSTITHNQFLDAMILSGDGGTIYTFGTPRSGKGVLAYNVFKGSYGKPSAYIYNDACGGSDDIAHHNLFLPNPQAVGKFVPLATCIKEWYNNTWAAPVEGRDYVFVVWDDSTTKPWNGEWKNNLLAYDSAKSWLFTDSANGDFSLTVGSEAIDKGVVIPGVTENFAGAAPDLGAFEYGVAPWVAGHTWGTPPDGAEMFRSATGTMASARLTRGRALASLGLRETAGGLLVTAAVGQTAELHVFDIRGRMVLSRRVEPATQYLLDRRQVGSGQYLVRITSGHQVFVRQFVAMPAIGAMTRGKGR